MTTSDQNQSISLLWPGSDPDKTGQLFSEAFGLTPQPVCYVYETDLAFSSREPYRSKAQQLEMGQTLRLHYLLPEKGFTVECAPENPCGRLYASDAAFLSLLYDYSMRITDHLLKPEITATCTVRSLQTGPKPDQPESKRLRYPKVGIDLCLSLRHAWPLFTILSVLHLKDEHKPACLSTTKNPWLSPFDELRQSFCIGPYDMQKLPCLLAAAWLELTKQF
ncbi:MAG: hypothetical protein KBG64_02510 [Clostridia bacterium]|nr:hypothetical protein [Clostridia bacterium]